MLRTSFLSASTGNLLAMPQDAGLPTARGQDALISEAVPIAATTVDVGASAMVTELPAPAPPLPPTEEPTRDGDRSDGAKPPSRLTGLAARLPRLAPWAVVLVCVIGAVLRFDTASHLWLDEALTVEIARRPLPGLFAALRHDGSPPLYYLLLHYWIKVFGTGDVAVRALSGVLSIATLPLAWLAGRRVGEYAAQTRALAPRTAHRAGIATVIFFATSPYAIRYGSETRMYSLVVLLVLAFGLALMRALERPGRMSWALLTLATAALAYTHYWTFLLLGSTAIGLWWRARRRPSDRSRHLRALAAMVAASVLFLPWLPTFAFQMLHTGTPWAPPVHAQVLLDTVFSWAGPTSSGSLLALVLLACAVLGLDRAPLTRRSAARRRPARPDAGQGARRPLADAAGPGLPRLRARRQCVRRALHRHRAAGVPAVVRARRRVAAGPADRRRHPGRRVDHRPDGRLHARPRGAHPGRRDRR